MACKLTSKGTKLYYDLDGVDPYTQLSSVQSLSGPTVTRSFEEQTELDSSGDWEEFCKSFRNGGVLTAQLYSKRSILTILYNTIEPASTAYYWKVLFPLETGDSVESKIIFQAWIESIGLEVPDKGNIITPLSLKVTGSVTYTAGS